MTINYNSQPEWSELEYHPEEMPFLPDPIPATAPHNSIKKRASERKHKASTALSTHTSSPGSPTGQRREKRFVLIGSIIGLLALLIAGAPFAIWKYVDFTPNVTLYQVSAPHNVDLSIGGGGIVYPQQQLDISYPVAERVVATRVKVGDHVSPDQPLIQLDPAQLNAALQQASDDMAAALVYLNSVSANGTALNIAQAQQNYDVIRSKYNELLAQTTSPFLHHGNLVSPMKGVVTALNVTAGQIFPASTPLLTIMDESNVIVHTKIPLANLGQVQLGQTALVTPSALANVNLAGTVTNIVPQADPQTDTFEVWVSIPNDKNILLPGMSAFTRIQTTATAITVPRLAVLYPNGDAAVYVVRNQVAHLQKIQVSGRSVDSIYVTSGLSVGDNIVLVGIDDVQDGQRVHIMNIQRSAS
jgi:RND family efflux transporter MFP subunit